MGDGTGKKVALLTVWPACKLVREEDRAHSGRKFGECLVKRRGYCCKASGVSDFQTKLRIVTAQPVLGGLAGK